MLSGTPYVPFCALKLLMKVGIGGETPAATYDGNFHFD